MKKITFFFCLLLSISSFSQKQLNSSEIRLALKKLNHLGSVLYIAAHPDDENTRLIAYMANEQKVRTAYLSLTRGDGGQNLIGTEKGPLMGLLRTQELLEARKIDGGEQFFTRAVDFGYSKTAEETFSKWDKDKILADVVWTIRQFKPDIIITRFPPDKRAGHGHHTASALLAAEAFDLAGDSNSYTNQLKYVSTWQPKRMFLNGSTWWDKELQKKVDGNPKKYTAIDIGTYNTLLGKSYAEIAAESRSMHKSQGFGTSKERGSKLEYLELIKGDPITSSIFDGIDLTWNSIEGGSAIENLLNEANTDFDAEHPEKIVPTLTQVYQLLTKLPNTNRWKQSKLQELQHLIESCLGLFVEVTANDYNAAIGNKVRLTTAVLNRSDLKLALVSINYGEKDTTIETLLQNNQLFSFQHQLTCSKKETTHPYWLNHNFEGTYQVNDQHLIGSPENEPTITARFTFKINGIELPVVRPVVYKWTDRVKGEIYRPFVLVPKVTANIADQVYVFASDQPKTIRIYLTAHQANIKGTISLQLPSGWDSEPNSISYEMTTKNEEKIVIFKVTPPLNESVGEAIIQLNNETKNVKSLVNITYDHLSTQTLLPLAKAKLVRLNVATKGKSIGYIKGAGDEIPIALEQLGYTVKPLDETTIKNSDLAIYDAIICGIRAYNTNDYMANVHTKLMEYVKNGGNYVVQYNTNRGVDTKIIGPYPFQLSRDRVTVEEANTTFLAPHHNLLNTPNKITPKDFEKWVQERGLYFPNKWDERYTAILGWNDPNEEITKGSLLVANYGKGSFIYTGISFFRELPAGVPGAFRLFANIVSYNK